MDRGGAREREHEGGEGELQLGLLIGHRSSFYRCARFPCRHGRHRIHPPHRYRARAAGARRLPVGSRADDRFAEAVRARGNLRGARGDRPPRPRRPREELGDFLYQAVFLAQLESEAGHFTIADSVEEHRRQAGAPASARVRARPGRSRRSTRRARCGRAGRKSRRRSAARSRRRRRCSAASRRRFRRCCARTTSASRAASVGFDWTGADEVVDKIQEEVDELREVVADARAVDRIAPRKKWATCSSRSPTSSRKLGIEPETALRKANDKFTRRFEAMERPSRLGRAMNDMTLEAERSGNE